jgi:hypothetical protein
MPHPNPLHRPILNGPGKFDLMLGLFDHTQSSPRPVQFSVRQTSGDIVTIDVSLDSLARESGDGESWNFTGKIIHHTISGNVSGYFSTKTRTGTLVQKRWSPIRPAQ